MNGCVWGTSLGTNANPWTGLFDGASHVVSGLDISTNGVPAGFIGVVGTGGSIIDFGFTGNVSLTVTGTGNIMAFAGGLVGVGINGGQISGSFASGDVSVTVTSNPDGNGDAAITIFAGGFSSERASSVGITDSYASSAVRINGTATASGSGSARVNIEVGGFIGYSNGATLTRSYASGPVTATLSASGGSSQSISDVRGGVIGWNGGGTFTNSVWDVTRTGRVIGANGSGGNLNPSGLTGLTTEQMTSAASFDATGQNWSITDGFSTATTWSICPEFNAGYPFLSGFHAVTPCVLPPPPPPAPVPASAPRDVTAVAGDRSAAVSWLQPVSPGSFPVSTYQVVAAPGGRGCLTATQSCDVTGLVNGTSYTFTVRALNGAGWSLFSPVSEAVTPSSRPVASILISGTRGDVRGRPGVLVNGTATGFGMGGMLRPWLRMAGQSTFVQGARVALVDVSGQFVWQRRTSQQVSIYVATPDGSVRSNVVTIPVR
jgi:hypothetical protein